MDEGEGTRVETSAGDRTVYGPGYVLRSPGVRRMSLDYYGAPGGQRRCCISARHREGQREVGCSENRHRAEPDEHAAQVRARERSAVGLGAVDASVYPRPLPHQRGEHPELAGRASALPTQACVGKTGFGRSTQQEVVALGVDLIGDRLEQPSPIGPGPPAIRVERISSLVAGVCDLELGGLAEPGFE